MRQSDNGYWYIWYNRVDRETLKTRNKRIAAQVFAIKCQEKRDEKLRSLTPKVEKPFKEFITEYTKWRAEEGKSAKTVDMDDLALRLLLEHTGNKNMGMISTHDVDTFHAAIMQSRKYKTPTGKEKVKQGCAKSTVNVYIRHLKVAFNRATRWGYILTNPYTDVKQYTEDEHEVPFLTQFQITDVLLPAIEEPDFRSMILVYLYTGCRGSEVCNMHRRDISIDEDTGRIFITIPKTKTHRARRIPISKALADVVATLPAKGYLFPRWRHVQTVSKKLKRYLRQVGLGHMWLHGLRHTTTSHLTMKGVPDRAKMEMLGHTQASTLKRYDHLSPDYLIEVADKLDFTKTQKPVKLVAGKRRK
jgi:integrase